MHSPENNRRPFKELEPSQYPFSAGRHFTLEGLPNTIVRLDRVDVSTKEKVAETVAKLNENKRLFESLEADGMRVARMEYVIGGEKNGSGFGESYALVEKINGADLRRIANEGEIDAQTMHEIDECYAAYLTHVERVLKEGGHYWSDMKRSNIVYGTREGDTAPHAYVVDVDPFFIKLSSEKERNSDLNAAANEMTALVPKLYDVLNEITWMERMAEGGTHRLTEVREKFQTLIAELRPILTATENKHAKAVLALIEERLKAKE